MERIHVLLVAGARPNFMKVAPLVHALTARGEICRFTLVHTGQHYDNAMSQAFFDQLRIPPPDIHLEVGSGSHATQTAEVMKRFEPVLERELPDVVIVVGDVNSTLACALVGAKLLVPVVHVEAGLRSDDRSMPEEINRIVTDRLSDRLYVTERAAIDNLVREGIEERRIVFAGNVMIDSLQANLASAPPARDTLAEFPGFLERMHIMGGHGLLTLHRPSNVDDPQVLRRLLDCLLQVGHRVPLVFPTHPRTHMRLQQAGVDLKWGGAILPIGPLGYLETLGLMRSARIVLTDSGGIQEETTALGVPCVTLRENTERPVTISEGTNFLAGSEPARILAAVESALSGPRRGALPELWDGHAADRIVDDLLDWLRSSPR